MYIKDGDNIEVLSISSDEDPFDFNNYLPQEEDNDINITVDRYPYRRKRKFFPDPRADLEGSDRTDTTDSSESGKISKIYKIKF